MSADVGHLSRFLPHIASLPQSGRLSRERLLEERFRLYNEGNLEIYFAPFDYINTDAKLLLIGITPGWTQMEIAYRVARRGLEQDKPLEEICSESKRAASFAGSMRMNLINMLNELRLPDVLEVYSSAELFDTKRYLVHTTSAVKYPVFVNGENYSGHHPHVLKHAKLKEFVDTLLAEELEQVSEALVIPLGRAVSQVLEYLILSERLEAERCLLDFPHPSGANGHRKRHFEAKKDVLKSKVINWFEP